MPDEPDDGGTDQRPDESADDSDAPQPPTADETQAAAPSSDDTAQDDPAAESDDEQPRANADADSDDKETGSDADVDAEADADADVDAETDADADVDAETDADADVDAETDADADADAETDADADADAETDADEPDADADSDDPAVESDGEPHPVETDGEGLLNGGPEIYAGSRVNAYSPPSSTESAHKKNRKQSIDDDDLGGVSTPPDDQEMPLADHIEEMILRLAVVLLFGAAGTAVGLLWASDVITFIWTDVIPNATERPPHIYHPLELWLTRIKVSALLGIMVALPMFVYQCYLFMRPGLYPNERKYYLAAVPTSVVLAGVGMIFSYLVILPILFQYFTFYSEGSAMIAYALGETFDLVITLTGFLAIVFQIPLFIMLAIMMGVTTREWLAEKRLFFWAGFLGLAFMFTFDPTAMAPVFVTLTMIVLFEGTLLLLKWTGR
ncbi:twin-arginine translocase subunit TatC [Halobacteria archaeon AArc-dxtr1]|nr:twin-arginine translocase subunit TatC [Halobacteria archaeon AArc-dxtr1]